MKRSPMWRASNGIAQSTRLLSGWGLKFFDYDNDGAVDLILANGHPDDMIDLYSHQVKYKEPLLLFHQESGKAEKRKRRRRVRSSRNLLQLADLRSATTTTTDGLMC